MDVDEDFVSLAQLRASLARASGTSSEDSEVDLADLASLEGADAAVESGWAKVSVKKGRKSMEKMGYLWLRKSKKGIEFWVNTLTKGRTKDEGPKGWKQISKRDAAKNLKLLTDCWWNKKSQYYCTRRYR